METIRQLIKGLVTNLFFTAILFLSAGRIDYQQGWIFLTVNILTTFMNVFSGRKIKDLLNERSKLGEGVKIMG